jgi:hypothetical protein
VVGGGGGGLAWSISDPRSPAARAVLLLDSDARRLCAHRHTQVVHSAVLGHPQASTSEECRTIIRCPTKLKIPAKDVDVLKI